MDQAVQTVRTRSMSTRMMTANVNSVAHPLTAAVALTVPRANTATAMAAISASGAPRHQLAADVPIAPSGHTRNRDSSDRLTKTVPNTCHGSSNRKEPARTPPRTFHWHLGQKGPHHGVVLSVF